MSLIDSWPQQGIIELALSVAPRRATYDRSAYRFLNINKTSSIAGIALVKKQRAKFARALTRPFAVSAHALHFPHEHVLVREVKAGGTERCVAQSVCVQSAAQICVATFASHNYYSTPPHHAS